MKNNLRDLKAAVIGAAILACLVILLLNKDYSYFSFKEIRLWGILFVVFLTLILFTVSNFSTTKSIIYGSLYAILAISFIPLGLFVFNNEFPTYYFISPDGKVNLSYFSGNVFEGREKKTVDENAVAAYNWQQGKTIDNAGRQILFYRIGADDKIVVFEHPVENGELLKQLDNNTFQKYVNQQIERANSFIAEGDIKKAKEIAEKFVKLDPSNDVIYRFSRKLSQYELQTNSEPVIPQQSSPVPEAGPNMEDKSALSAEENQRSEQQALTKKQNLNTQQSKRSQRNQRWYTEEEGDEQNDSCDECDEDSEDSDEPIDGEGDETEGL